MEELLVYPKYPSISMLSGLKEVAFFYLIYDDL